MYFNIGGNVDICAIYLILSQQTRVEKVKLYVLRIGYNKNPKYQSFIALIGPRIKGKIKEQKRSSCEKKK